MSAPSSPLILASEIKSVTDAIVIDARSGPDAVSRYRAGHLEGALHVDLDVDLAEKPIDPAHGGRHPLPDLKTFAAFVGNLGISPSTSVIVYDDKNGANAAARFWWMLRALGHKKVQVVDGGLEAILRERLSIQTGIQKPTSTTAYPTSEWLLPTVGIDDVSCAVKKPEALVIDVREAYRYKGEREPIDLVAGHIPGAINIPYLNNLKVDGTFRATSELATIYKDAIGNRKTSDVIVHCGSGVTACHTLLALEQVGIEGANLYVGSWGEWSRRDMPIGTGNQ